MTHTKKFFFSGRTTKQKNTFFLQNPTVSAQKLGRKRKNCQNPFQAFIRLKKRRRPLSHQCREGDTLVVRPLKKLLFLCVSSLSDVMFFGYKRKIDALDGGTMTKCFYQWSLLKIYFSNKRSINDGMMHSGLNSG